MRKAERCSATSCSHRSALTCASVRAVRVVRVVRAARVVRAVRVVRVVRAVRVVRGVEGERVRGHHLSVSERGALMVINLVRLVKGGHRQQLVEDTSVGLARRRVRTCSTQREQGPSVRRVTVRSVHCMQWEERALGV
jgi:hypothetical protein